MNRFPGRRGNLWESSPFQQMWGRDWRTWGQLWNSVVCVAVSHFLTCCEEVLHPPLYTPWGPLSCEINLWRQLGQHGQQGALPGPGERNQWHREEQWQLSFPSILRMWCQDSAPSPQLGLTWTLLWGLSPIHQLEPCLSTAKRNLELLIYLLVNQFLRVRSKLAGQCPHTSCST